MYIFKCNIFLLSQLCQRYQNKFKTFILKYRKHFLKLNFLYYILQVTKRFLFKTNCQFSVTAFIIIVMSYQLFLYILLKCHFFTSEYTLGLYKIFEVNTIFGVGNTLLWLSNRLKISVVKKWERKHFPKWQFFNEVLRSTVIYYLC